MAELEFDSGERKFAESFGRCVTRHREAAGLSPTELARASGLSKPDVWLIENGQTIADLRAMGRLAKALEMPLHVLCEGVDLSDLALEDRAWDKEGSLQR